MRQYDTVKGVPHLLADGTDAERVAWCAYSAMMSGYRDAVSDRQAVMAVRDARACGQEDMVLSLWLGRRAARLAYLSMTQRTWQRTTRRAGRARHHDSIALREKYVRCAN